MTTRRWQTLGIIVGIVVLLTVGFFIGRSAGWFGLSPQTAVQAGEQTISKQSVKHWTVISFATDNVGAAFDPPQWKKCAQSLSVAECQAAAVQARTEAIDFLIQNAWVQQEAARRGVHVTTAQIQQSYNARVKGLSGGAAGLRKLQQQSHQTEGDLKYRTQLDLLQAGIQKKLYATAGQRFTPTAVMIKQYYQQHRTSLKTSVSYRLRLGVAKNKARAERAVTQLRAGTSWQSATSAEGVQAIGGLHTVQANDIAFPLHNQLGGGRIIGPALGDSNWYFALVQQKIAPKQQSLTAAKPTIVKQLLRNAQVSYTNGYSKQFEAYWKQRTTCRKEYATTLCGKTVS